jgi:hypothetical protein
VFESAAANMSFGVRLKQIFAPSAGADFLNQIRIETL